MPASSSPTAFDCACRGATRSCATSKGACATRRSPSRSSTRTSTSRGSKKRPTGSTVRHVAVCAHCTGPVEEEHRFCPWCAAPQRRKLVEFFLPHPRDVGKALRVSRYLGDEPHVRFSVWSEQGVVEGAVSLDEAEAERLASFLRAGTPRRERTTFGRLLSEVLGR